VWEVSELAGLAVLPESQCAGVREVARASGPLAVLQSPGVLQEVQEVSGLVASQCAEIRGRVAG
ncbi:hypothetical protein CYMTET_27579, partial [Cymbomonas tetramitiformis]